MDLGASLYLGLKQIFRHIVPFRATLASQRMPERVEFLQVDIANVHHQGYEDCLQSAGNCAYVYAEVPIADNWIRSHIDVTMGVEALAFQQMACIPVLRGS